MTNALPHWLPHREPTQARQQKAAAVPARECAPGSEGAPAAAVEDAQGWFDRGVHAEEQGRLEAAVWAYERALASGASAEVHFNLGNVLFLLRRIPEAAEQFRAATDLEPDYVEAWNNLGNVRSELGRTAEAAEAYRRALAIAPDYSDAHYNFAELLFSCDEYDEARRHFRTSGSGPASSDGQLAGTLRNASDGHAAAIEHWLQLWQRSKWALSGLARLLQSLQQPPRQT